jgi:DNA polymerase-3 subunit epsilon
MHGRLKFTAWLVALYGSLVTTAAAALLLVQSGISAAGLVFVATALLAACGAVVAWLLRRFATAPRALAEQTRLVLANPGYRVQAGAPELAALASEINRLAGAYHGAQGEMEAKIAESSSSLEEERNRLAALMSDLSQAVLLCSAEGRILLYNEQARALFSGAAAPLGLGRSVFGLLERAEIVHALDKLQYALDQGTEAPSARFITALAGRGLARVQMAPFLAAGGRLGGAVLALDDVTRFVGQELQRRELLQALAAGVRAPVANIRAAAENMVGFPEMEATQRQRFAQIIAEESINLSKSIDQALGEYADAIKASIALEDMRAADLVRVARPRIAAHVSSVSADEVDDELWLRVDSFALVQALGYLAWRLGQELGVRALRLRARSRKGFAELDLLWSGAALPAGELARWESEPMQVGAEQTPLTMKDVLERHGGESWHEHDGAGGNVLRLLLPIGEPAPQAARRRVPQEGRPEYYDFDLFQRAAHPFHEQRLAELPYTVFDTETTGLEPSAGDEIISLGGVRIVNGRLLKQEVFEQLVNPRRPLNRESARVHGIDAAMLASQPTLAEVLPRFHRFCEDTVLVAHNAAFDMRFLELKEAATGIRFDQPVLDTLLLSAVVHPSLEDHRLEAIAERLGIRVIGRHTALGDALLTGEILLKLLPLLAERGIATLKQALEASQRTYHARLRY